MGWKLLPDKNGFVQAFLLFLLPSPYFCIAYKLKFKNDAEDTWRKYKKALARKAKSSGRTNWAHTRSFPCVPQKKVTNAKVTSEPGFLFL